VSRFNSTKTAEVVIITASSRQRVIAVNECKYLGLSIDTKLNWKADVSYVTSTAAQTVGVLYKIRQ